MGSGSVDEVALLLELFDELAELFGEAVHGALEAGQQVKRHDDGEADAGDCGQQVLFHAGHLLVRGRLSRGAKLRQPEIGSPAAVSWGNWIRRALRRRPCGCWRPCRRRGRRH